MSGESAGRILSLTLTGFRSYEAASLAAEGRSVYLYGANGAGKTNLLEAISLLSPGRGLRGAPLAELGRTPPGAGSPLPWAVAAEIAGEAGPVPIGTGVESPGASRRKVRISGQDAAAGDLARHLRPIWLTPAQDRLFLEGASERRRFFDRLVFAARAAHAADVLAYERALRERSRLLAHGGADPDWLAALEAGMAAAGARMAVARAGALTDLDAEIAARGGGPFPAAALALTGEWERRAGQGAPPEALEADLGAALAASRTADAAAGRALVGPHRGDLAARDAATGRPADRCSTGEQKALLLGVILAQARRLSRANDGPNPILLFDEVAAHLDRDRRAALFDEMEALSLQAFLTGTDEALFEPLRGRALGVRVEASRLIRT